MIKRLSDFITAAEEFVYSHTALRYLWYIGIVLALLLFWVYGEDAGTAFVYNAF